MQTLRDAVVLLALALAALTVRVQVGGRPAPSALIPAAEAAVAVPEVGRGSAVCPAAGAAKPVELVTDAAPLATSRPRSCAT